MSEIISNWPMIKEAANLGVAVVAAFIFLGLVVYLSLWSIRKLHPLLMTQNQLIENNTRATDAICESVNTLGNILHQVTTNFALHDQRQAEMQKNINGLQQDVTEIKIQGVTKTELTRVHDRIDTLGNDISEIKGKVS